MLPPVTVVAFPDKDNPVRLSQYADASLHNVIVVPDLVDHLVVATMAQSLLDALGVRADIRGRLSHPQDAVAAVPRWLIAHQTQHVVLISPQHIKDEGLHTAVQMAASAGASLVLATNERNAAPLLERLARWDAHEVPLPQVEAALAAATPPSQPADDSRAAPAPPPLPTGLPEFDFYAFNDACREVLTADDHALVHALYSQARQAASHLISAGGPTHDRVLTLIDDLVEGRPGAPERTTVLRGLQAGMFQHGWLMQVNLGVFNERAVKIRLSQTTTAMWQSLRGYADTERAALIALVLHGLEKDAIRALTIHDLAPEQAHQWHPDAVPYLTAHYLTRIAKHANPSDPYMTCGSRSYGVFLTEANADLGLAVGGTGYRAERRMSNVSRHGLRFINLNDGGERIQARMGTA